MSWIGEHPWETRAAQYHEGKNKVMLTCAQSPKYEPKYGGIFLKEKYSPTPSPRIGY